MSKTIENLIKVSAAVGLAGAVYATCYQPSEQTQADVATLKTCLSDNKTDLTSVMFDDGNNLIDAGLADGDLVVKKLNPLYPQQLVDSNADGSVDGFSPLIQAGYAGLVHDLVELCSKADQAAPLEARHCGEDTKIDILETGPSVVQLRGVASGNSCSGFITSFDHLTEPVIVTASHCVFQPGEVDERLFVATWPAQINPVSGEVEEVYVSAAVPIVTGYENGDEDYTNYSSYDISILGLPYTSVTRKSVLEQKDMEPSFLGEYRMWGHPQQVELSSASLSHAVTDDTNGSIHMQVMGDCNDGVGISGGPVTHENKVIGLVSSMMFDGSYLFAPMSAVNNLAANLTQADVDGRTALFAENGFYVQHQAAETRPLILTKDGYITVNVNTYKEE
jgi:hypothetical protein